MHTSLKRIFTLVFALAAIVVLSGGCASEQFIYNKDRKVVANVWEGTIGEGRGLVPCAGSIEVFFHGDFYGIYFKTNSTSPREVYFTTAKHYGYDKLPLKLTEARGVADLEGDRRVVLDIEYRDTAGHWTKLPFNGRHKIDAVWPDDLPAKPNISL